MRMWMVNPKIMCRRHLLGEHVEHHMFLGTILKKKHLFGYIENNCFEWNSLKQRHEDLVSEMKNRGYVHNSPLDIDSIKKVEDFFTKVEKEAKVLRKESFDNLMKRCPECFSNFKKIEVKQ